MVLMYFYLPTGMLRSRATTAMAVHGWRSMKQELWDANTRRPAIPVSWMPGSPTGTGMTPAPDLRVSRATRGGPGFRKTWSEGLRHGARVARTGLFTGPNGHDALAHEIPPPKSEATPMQATRTISTGCARSNPCRAQGATSNDGTRPRIGVHGPKRRPTPRRNPMEIGSPQRITMESEWL